MALLPPEGKVPVWMTKGRVLLGICEPWGCVLLSVVPVVHVGGPACMCALKSYGWSVHKCVYM